MTPLERAKQALAQMNVPTGIRFRGVPVEEFDKDDLVIILGHAQQMIEQERSLHDCTLGMLQTCSSRRR